MPASVLVLQFEQHFMGFDGLFSLILVAGIISAFVKFFTIKSDSSEKRFLGVVLIVFTLGVFFFFLFEFAMVLSYSSEQWSVELVAFLISGLLVTIVQIIGRRIWETGPGRTVVVWITNILSAVIAAPVLYVLYALLTQG